MIDVLENFWRKADGDTLTDTWPASPSLRSLRHGHHYTAPFIQPERACFDLRASRCRALQPEQIDGPKLVVLANRRPGRGSWRPATS